MVSQRPKILRRHSEFNLHHLFSWNLLVCLDRFGVERQIIVSFGSGKSFTDLFLGLSLWWGKFFDKNQQTFCSVCQIAKVSEQSGGRIDTNNFVALNLEWIDFSMNYQWWGYNFINYKKSSNSVRFLNDFIHCPCLEYADFLTNRIQLLISKANSTQQITRRLLVKWIKRVQKCLFWSY